MLVTLFSDASMCERRKVGGWAAWLKSGRERAAYRTGGAFGVRVSDTSMAEAMAVVNALACGLRDGFIRPEDEVLVQTDNDSVMGVLEGTARRRMSKAQRLRKGLSGRQAKAIVRERNAEISIVAAAFAARVEAGSLSIRWRHVKGHRGNVDRRSAVNSFCDREARVHMQRARGMTVPSLVEIERTRMVGAGPGRTDDVNGKTQ